MPRDLAKAAATLSRYRNANRELIRAINARSRARNADKIKARKRAEYLRDKDTPAYRARIAAYQAATRNAKREYDRKYRATNKEKLAQLKSVWRAENAALLRVVRSSYKARRRATEKGGDSTKTIKEWMVSQAKVCRWCEANCETGFHIDHVMPLAKGGKHVIANLCIACPTCNIRKNARDPAEFAAEIERHRVDISMLRKVA